MADLELVSTEDLIDEIRTRTDCGLVAFGRSNAKGEGNLQGSYTWWGGTHEVLGMAHDAAFRIVTAIDLVVEEDDDGDSEPDSDLQDDAG